MHRLSAADRDAVLRELYYGAAAGAAFHFAAGSVAATQQIMLDRGWLDVHPTRPGYLIVTDAGRALLAAQARRPA